jgi:glycine/D-amino acid oxidase-like deaminating enzyme
VEKFDVAIIGGGIIGTSAAAYLAEAGRTVVLFERAALAAGASGRNSGVIQHPFDAPFVELHQRSLALYRELSAAEDGFELPERPAGLMLVSFDEDAVLETAAAIEHEWPELAPSALLQGAASALEPVLDERLAACRLATG